MVTRRGWERGPIRFCKRDARAVRPTHGLPKPSNRYLIIVTLSAAKGLSRLAECCFAEFTLSEANMLSMAAESRSLLPQLSP